MKQSVLTLSHEGKDTRLEQMTCSRVTQTSAESGLEGLGMSSPQSNHRPEDDSLMNGG